MRLNPLYAAVLGSTAVFSNLFAEEDPSSLMDTVTVMATKSPKSTFDYPGIATVVDPSNPAVAGSSGIKQLLKDVPGVEFDGSARRNGQTITMRGYNTNGLVILLDGVRQRGESAHDGKFFIDPNLLKSVEVIRGPSSSLYGSGGLGGVIAFETKNASDFLAPGETSGAITTAGFGSVNDEWLLSQTGFMRNDKIDLLASFTKRNSGDIELGDGSSLSAKDDISSGLIKAGWSISPFSTVKVNLQQYQNDAKEPNNPQSSSDSDRFNKKVQTNLASLDYQYNNPDNPWLNLKTKLYHNTINIDEKDRSSGRSLAREMDTSGINIENQSTFQSSDNFKQVFTYGVEYYNEEQNGKDSTGSGGESGGIPDAENDYWGVFFQDEIEFSGQFGKLLFIPGVRLDNYEAENATGSKLDESEVSPKFGMTYKPQEWLMLFGSYAHAFRAPTMTEMFTTGTHFVIPGLGSNVFVPNPNLRPETNKTLEYGFGMQFDNVIQTDDKAHYKVARFHTTAEDYIDTQVNVTFFPSCCGTSTSTNIDKASLDGLDFEGGYENKRIRATLNYSEISGRNDNTKEYLTSITPETVRTNVALKLPEHDSVIGWRGTFAATHYKVSDSDNRRDSFSVHDIYYQWQPEKISNLTVNLGVDNLFDKDYSRVFAGSVERGRNYKIQASYEW